MQIEMTVIFVTLLNVETRNAWQSLAYSPLGAVVSPSMLMKHLLPPCLAALPRIERT